MLKEHEKDTPAPAPGYPKVLFSLVQRVPPVVVNNDDELKAYDPAQWTTIPPQAKTKEADTWPKIYGNVNLLPKIVSSPDEASQLGSDWVEIPLPPQAQPK